VSDPKRTRPVENNWRRMTATNRLKQKLGAHQKHCMCHNVDSAQCRTTGSGLDGSA
jgi:hypothetical protein